MMGLRPEPSDITSSTIKISAIEPKTLTEHNVEVDYQQHARAIMFKLMGGSLFPNTTGNKFVWMPYPNLETLPPFCSVGLPIWTSRIPLIYGYVVEMCYPDRFCRQFGALQRVPLDVVYDRRLHNIKLTTMELGDNERHYLGVWEGRYAANVLMEFGMSDATPEYRQWYYLHGRRQIETLHISLEQATSPFLLSYRQHYLVCHQRLDPGRHPDGFVPSHEVALVHDLLGDCIRALGHASILNHPQQQPVYNPGHIPRRAYRSDFDQMLLQIASKNQEAYNWLNVIPKHKWALSHDEGGARCGIMTTNSSESFNHVLKGCRCLPVYAIVQFTYDKLVKLFAERRTNGYNIKSDVEVDMSHSLNHHLKRKKRNPVSSRSLKNRT
ncbi:unnamed protein product [Cuscuta campestris]|uniref:Aminotransferase-like plant mobile domain-containing protein n=1 Tax=Cuscuta campestris TaxID=132261 RepID=A0A484NTL4_9ASTE|nr:unnamed protein product [Cuscuta campestris]